MGESGYDLVGSERDVLLAYLNKMRNAVVRTSEGVTDYQVRRPGVPSGTKMSVPADASRDDVVAAYRTACARGDEIVRACPDMSTMAAIANPGEEQKDSLRSIVAHMIEETARHAGHADILREQVDGATGL
jgi:hypothetical protein